MGVSQYRHEALVYSGGDDFARTCAGVVAEGLAADDRLIVLAVASKLRLLSDELAGAADDVTFVATDVYGRNPSRLTTMLWSFLSGADGRHSVGVKETALPGRSRAGLEETIFVDHMLNHESLSEWPLSVVCLFDSVDLDADTELSVRQAHAVIRGRDANPDYLPGRGGSIFAELPGPPPDAAHTFAAAADLLAETRAFVRTDALGRGLSGDRVDDLVLAANEVVTNSIRYAGGRASVAMWREGDTVVCEVRDQGHFGDPMAGRVAPAPSDTTGRGLWLVNELCDLVQIRSAEAETVVRMYLDV